jgi:hypothetical protein
MAEGSDQDQAVRKTVQGVGRPSGFRVAVALAAVAALGAGIAIQQILERRLSKPEKARLKFYRYLREKGHLDS